MVPLRGALAGELAAADLRTQELAARALQHLAAVPANRPRLLRLVPEVLAVLAPRTVVTVHARVHALRFLGLLAIPYLGDDEKAREMFFFKTIEPAHGLKTTQLLGFRCWPHDPLLLRGA